MAVGVESSDDEIEILQDETLHRQGCIPKSLHSVRLCVCLQRHLAVATHQFHSPDTVRPVCLEDSRKVRSGFAACYRCYESGCACDLSVTRSGTLVQTSSTPVPVLVARGQEGCLIVRITASLVLTVELLVEPFVSRQRIPLTAAAARAVGTDRNAMVQGSRQSRQPLFWANRQYLRLRARPPGPGREWNQPLLGTELQEPRGTVPARFPSAGAYLRSLRLPATAERTRKSPVQSRLAFAERGCSLRIQVVAVDWIFFHVQLFFLCPPDPRRIILRNCLLFLKKKKSVCVLTSKEVDGWTFACEADGQDEAMGL